MNDRSTRPRGRPANTPTDLTRARILDAARHLFANRGYAATTNRAIAERAGLAHTAIYNHFHSKAGLFRAVFDEVEGLLTAELARAMEGGTGGDEFPLALLTAAEVMRATDPTAVAFLASMYVEINRHDELRQEFQGGPTAPIVETISALSGGGGAGRSDHFEQDLWFWIVFGIGLAQFGSLASDELFAAAIAGFRGRFSSP